MLRVDVMQLKFAIRTYFFNLAFDKFGKPQPSEQQNNHQRRPRSNGDFAGKSHFS